MNDILFEFLQGKEYSLDQVIDLMMDYRTAGMNSVTLSSRMDEEHDSFVIGMEFNSNPQMD